MNFSLAPTAAAAGYRLEAHETIGSTNQRALELGTADDPGRLWVVSARQESGRGRRGRAWSTREGNLAATQLVVTDGNLANAATLGFVAGLALSQALEALVPEHSISIAADGATRASGGRFELKWPNDVLAGGAKMAGILLESALMQGDRAVIAVGIGVNVVSHPEDLPYPATSLHAMGAKADAAMLFQALSDAWVHNHAIWDEGRGLETIRSLWLDRAAGLGGHVAVRVDGAVVRGIFETIDADCRFIIRDENGKRISVTAGDVHFGAVASASAA